MPVSVNKAGSDMAKETGTVLKGEKIITIGLRKGWLKVPKNERGRYAVAALRRHVSKTMNIDAIKISARLNHALWARGAQHPPASIRIKITEDEGVVTARLPEELIVKKESKKPAKKGLLEKAQAVQQKVVQEGTKHQKPKPAEGKKKHEQPQAGKKPAEEKKAEPAPEEPKEAGTSTGAAQEQARK